MSNQGLIWVCFEPREYPYPLILYGGPNPNWGKDVYVPYVPADRIEELEAKLVKAMNVLCYMIHPKLDDALLVWMNEKEMRKAAKAVLAELEGKEIA